MMRVARILAPALLVFTGSIVLGDDYPQGCVSCHVSTEQQDMRLNVIFDQIEHSRAGQRTLLIPTGCQRCHADEDGVGGALSTLIHRSHYTDPIKEKFTGEFNGDCVSCHKMDTDTGQAEIRSGKRNWQLRIVPE